MLRKFEQCLELTVQPPPTPGLDFSYSDTSNEMKLEKIQIYIRIRVSSLQPAYVRLPMNCACWIKYVFLLRVKPMMANKWEEICVEMAETLFARPKFTRMMGKLIYANSFVLVPEQIGRENFDKFYYLIFCLDLVSMWWWRRFLVAMIRWDLKS